jgi:hypothetical protein
MERQLPPHLSPVLPAAPGAQMQNQSASPRSQATLRNSTNNNQAHDSSTAESPSSPVVDIEQVRKAAMHNAAERAKLRREQEEREREEQKERARRKAADLEAKIKSDNPQEDNNHIVCKRSCAFSMDSMPFRFLVLLMTLENPRMLPMRLVCQMQHVTSQD